MHEYSMEKGFKSDEMVYTNATNSKSVIMNFTGDAEYDVDTREMPGESVPFSIWTRLRQWSGMIGAEEFGIERILEHMRTDQHPRDYFTIFFAANCNAATLATGFLGHVTL
ncbi:purine-cytosine permease FCY2 [Penicillium angulare]|uniref:purine-cytosine permease FCY2 n=1 Tax=Penicillium angulare TaxID=116970 RepID=UPI002541113B|nr:purine-cytosine permease FCY2 [Penicillium angulare]KAJ5267905.1 purine-cytosine permease FCY2 [Penicillium angulare]